MIKALLIIRLKQVYRSIAGIGLLRMLFLAAFIAYLGFFLYSNASEKLTSLYISIGFLLLILLIHLKRRDKQFLKSNFSNFKTLLLTEYFLVSIPILTCLIIQQQWISLLPLLGLFVIVHLNFKTKYSSLNTKLQALIPSDSFEWKAGLRKQFFLLVPVYLIAIITSYYIGSVPLAILIIGISTFSFYENCESQQLLLAYELSSKKLLQLKVKRQLQLYSVATAPLIILFLVFHNDIWYIPIIEYLIFCSLHLYAIMIKYAFFSPNIKSTAAQTMGTISILGGIIPIFLPVVWALTIWFYIKSIHKLNYYLDDFD